MSHSWLYCPTNVVKLTCQFWVTKELQENFQSCVLQFLSIKQSKLGAEITNYVRPLPRRIILGMGAPLPSIWTMGTHIGVYNVVQGVTQAGSGAKQSASILILPPHRISMSMYVLTHSNTQKLTRNVELLKDALQSTSPATLLPLPVFQHLSHQHAGVSNSVQQKLQLMRRFN